MKTLKSTSKLFIIQLGLFSLLLFCDSNCSFGQCSSFTPASVTEFSTNSGGISAVNNIGNDSRFGGSLGTMIVNVWDGNTPGLGWDDGSTRGYTSISSYTTDPDVVVVKSNGTWYALIAHGDSFNGTCVCDMYVWGSGSFTYSSTVTLANNLFSTAINIDADRRGNISIVWDDANGIEIVTGTTNTGAAPSLNSAVIVGSTSGMIMPDVSLYPLYPNVNTTSTVRITALDNSQATVYEIEDEFADITSGQSLLVSPFWSNTLMSGYYEFPRIACPHDIVNTVPDDWTISTAGVVSGSRDIYNFSSHNTGLFSNVYTDGSTALCAINNSRTAAVTYDISKTIVNGWICLYGGNTGNTSGHFNPNAPVAVICDIDGSLLNPSPTYFIVPNNNLSSNPHSQKLIALAGRDNSNILYTYYDGVASDIIYKEVISSSSNLKMAHSAKDDENIQIDQNPVMNTISLSSNNEEGYLYQISVCSLLGEEVITVSGTLSNINRTMQSQVNTLRSGIYFIKVIDGANKSYTLKFIKA